MRLRIGRIEFDPACCTRNTLCDKSEVVGEAFLQRECPDDPGDSKSESEPLSAGGVVRINVRSRPELALSLASLTPVGLSCIIHTCVRGGWMCGRMPGVWTI